MKQIFLLFLILLAFSSCKKERKQNLPQNINYRKIDLSVKPEDTSPLALDINNDGSVDYSFFVVRTFMSNGDELYAGVNPIGINTAIMGEPDDDRFLSMATVFAPQSGSLIQSGLAAQQLWSSDHGFLVIKNSTNYLGAWGNQSPQLLGIRLKQGDQSYFGWIRLAFNRSTATLTAIDCAWNTLPNQEIKAGAD